MYTIKVQIIVQNKYIKTSVGFFFERRGFISGRKEGDRS